MGLRIKLDKGNIHPTMTQPALQVYNPKFIGSTNSHKFIGKVNQFRGKIYHSEGHQGNRTSRKTRIRYSGNHCQTDTPEHHQNTNGALLEHQTRILANDLFLGIAPHFSLRVSQVILELVFQFLRCYSFPLNLWTFKNWEFAYFKHCCCWMLVGMLQFHPQPHLYAAIPFVPFILTTNSCSVVGFCATFHFQILKMMYVFSQCLAFYTPEDAHCLLWQHAGRKYGRYRLWYPK